MSNNERDFFDEIKAIFEERDKAISTQDAATNARNKQLHENEIFFAVQDAIKEQTSDIRRNDPSRDPNYIKGKTIRRPKTPTRNATFISPLDEIKEMLKQHPIVSTLAAIAFTAGIIISIPNIKTTSQMNKLTTSYSAQLEDFNYGEKQGMFSKIKLTIEPSDFIKNSNLTPNSHMRLYILSTVIQDSDFYTILKELGYRGFDDYVNKLGFRHTEDFRAGEHYSREYEEKLKDLITEVKKNQDLLPQYLEMYPELGFIYDARDEDQAMSTTNNGRGL